MAVDALPLNPESSPIVGPHTVNLVSLADHVASRALALQAPGPITLAENAINGMISAEVPVVNGVVLQNKRGAMTND